MAFLDRYGDKESKFSRWKLSELVSWNERNLLPTYQNQDIENYCTFHGALDVLSWFAPDVATLVHGSAGCVTSFSSSRAYPNCHEFRPKPYSTAMNSTDIVYGAEKKLSDSLVEVDRRHHPKVIVVMTNCCSYIIGENRSDAVKKVADKVKADILELEIGGCSGHGFRKGADLAFDLLFNYVAKKVTSPIPPPEPSINLFTKRVSGRPAENQDVREMSRLLEKIGVRLNTVLRMGASLDDLYRIPNATANMAFCFTLGHAPLVRLNKLFGQPYAPSTFPMGLRGTLRWVDSVAKLVGVKNTLHDDAEVEKYRAKVEELKVRLAGREAYIWQPGDKGLATALFAEDLGLKPYLFNMSYYLQKKLRKTVDYVLENGHDFTAILSGKQEVLLKAREKRHAERPLLFMPKKFWLGELPTVTFNFFVDPVLGFKGIDFLLREVEYALAHAGQKDYRLFNRYIETRFHAVDWKIDGPPMRGIDPDDPKWQREVARL
ncbi:hypothetical protein GWO43_09295 [candidate division KSB1 bacterium]|nr:hypothetical protein [candidate division KSB1 bacterium]NIR69343.1 hypothetical protein [candidate division KSB1 bacterium]NIS24161.1 hypothetical protein [candidate division KSB1 bacterium]NIT71076.1 hypothetical protein [candidate division KSB1 bacterium]NIU24780.1 hypothetical protein [candidate division KSB1 bacterium]